MEIDLVEVLHLVSVGEPGLLVVARLDDKHLVVGKHLSESVGEDFAHVDVDLMHLELLLVTLGPPVSAAAGIISHLQLMRTRTQEKGNKTTFTVCCPNFFHLAAQITIVAVLSPFLS